METVTIVFYAVISICAVLIMLALTSIADYLRHIRNDLRDHFKREREHWIADWEWKHEE